jgi:hypothetical protein
MIAQLLQCWMMIFLKNFVFEQKEIDKKNRHITRNSSLGEFPYLDFSKHFQLLRRPAGGIFFRSHLPQSFLGSFVLSYPGGTNGQNSTRPAQKQKIKKDRQLFHQRRRR